MHIEIGDWWVDGTTRAPTHSASLIETVSTGTFPSIEELCGVSSELPQQLMTLPNDDLWWVHRHTRTILISVMTPFWIINITTTNPSICKRRHQHRYTDLHPTRPIVSNGFLLELSPKILSKYIYCICIRGCVMLAILQYPTLEWVLRSQFTSHHHLLWLFHSIQYIFQYI